MKKIWKMLGIALLGFVFLGGGRGLFSSAAVEVNSQDFVLGTGVTGKWNKDTQELTLVGSGKIDRQKWESLKETLSLTSQPLNKIEFTKDIKFPDNANNFFSNFKTAKVIFDPDMDTSNVTNMRAMFSYAPKFNSDISKWNVSKVTNMEFMFWNAENFNSDLSNWDVSNVTSMEFMFNRARNFNSDLSNWNVGKVTNMCAMFGGAENFNSDISKWDVSNVTSMEFMFNHAENFNSDLSNWNVGKVTNMQSMFSYAPKFNSDLSNWNVGKVTNMRAMFDHTPKFNSDLSKWDVGKVTNMRSMFSYAPKFNSDLSKWDVGKVTNMGSMFWNAENFNSDLSNWDFSSVTTAYYFIVDDNRKMSFSTKNHDTLLQKLENDYLAGKLDPRKLRRIDIQAKYCASYPLRDKLETYGFGIYSDMFNCNPVLKINSPTTQSSGTIVDTTISFESDFPLNEGDLPAALYVDPSNTTVEYSDFTCSLDSANSKKVDCTIKITSTHEKADQKLTVKFVKELGTGRKIEASATANYLIDTQAPELAQLKIDTTAGINTPTVTLSQLPGDQGGAGTEKCELSYIDADGANQLSPLSVGVAQSLNLNSSEAVHTLEVKCYDKVGNSSTNTIKFPPIIEFSDENITLSKNDMQGTFTVYSPSGTPIQTISIEDPDGTDVHLGTCTSQEDNGTSAPWNNSQEKPVICDFSNVTKSGTIVVKAKDSTGAEGKNSQTFVKDIVAPVIAIQPEPLLTGGSISFVITVTDDNGIDKDNVALLPDSSLDASEFACAQKTATKVQCTFTAQEAVINGELMIKAEDNAGNVESKTQSGYTIDKTAPTISDIGKTDSDQGKKWTVSFSVKDEGGAGLWKEDEKNDPKYDDSAITWGIGEDENCQNYQMNGSLDPQSSEPFTLNFEFTDVSQNGKYLCIVAKDKVGNAYTGYLTDPININVAPTLGDASTTLDENAPIGTEVFTLNGVDSNSGDTLSYDIISGNTGNVFTIDANKLKVNGALDYETLSGYTLVVQVKDQFGLSSTGSYTITLNDIDETVPSGGYSGGGGGSSHSSTSSSSTSTSSTQQKPETPSNAEPVKTEQVKTEVFNPTIQTTCFNPLDKQTIDQGNKMSELLRIAHQMLYSYSLTKWQGTKDFAPGRSLTREEAARFMTEFATNVLCRKASRSYNDHFTDLEKANPELLPYIKKSYEYLIFNGDKNADGKKEKTTFRPKELITVGELSAIMTRLVRNELLEEVKGDRARNYKLYISSITPKSHLVDEVRGTVAEVIYDVYRNNSYELKDIGYVIKK